MSEERIVVNTVHLLAVGACWWCSGVRAEILAATFGFSFLPGPFLFVSCAIFACTVVACCVLLVVWFHMGRAFQTSVVESVESCCRSVCVYNVTTTINDLHFERLPVPRNVLVGDMF